MGARRTHTAQATSDAQIDAQDRTATRNTGSGQSSSRPVGHQPNNSTDNDQEPRTTNNGVASNSPNYQRGSWSWTKALGRTFMVLAALVLVIMAIYCLARASSVRAQPTELSPTIPQITEKLSAVRVQLAQQDLETFSRAHGPLSHTLSSLNLCHNHCRLPQFNRDQMISEKLLKGNDWGHELDKVLFCKKKTDECMDCLSKSLSDCKKALAAVLDLQKDLEKEKEELSVHFSIQHLPSLLVRFIATDYDKVERIGNEWLPTLEIAGHNISSAYQDIQFESECTARYSTQLSQDEDSIREIHARATSVVGA